MKRLDTYWVAAACVAAFSVVIGLALVRRTSAPPVRLNVPTSPPATQGFKLNEEIPATFAVKAATAPATAPAEFDGDRLLLPVD
jgi:hypothetical protein